MPMDDLLGGSHVNIGRDYVWTTQTFKEVRDLSDTGQEYLNNLQNRYNDNSSESQVRERRKKNGYVYPSQDQVNDLPSEQRIIVLAAVLSLSTLSCPSFKLTRATMNPYKWLPRLEEQRTMSKDVLFTGFFRSRFRLFGRHSQKRK